MYRTCISALVNDPNVPLPETMTVSGHITYSAHMTYAKTDKNADKNTMDTVARKP
jgi:hypothetical protein